MSGRSGTATCALGANQSAIGRSRRLPYCLLFIALLLGAAILHQDGGASFPTTAKIRSNSQWAHLYASLPLSFEANRGQTDPSVNFVSRGQGYTLFLAGSDAVLTLRHPKSATQATAAPSPGDAIRMHLLGANAHAAVSGGDELPGKANYFIGNDPSKWRTNVPTYAKVKYEGVYPGVDLVYYGSQSGTLEYDFVVAPGADPSAIQMGIDALQGIGHDHAAPLQITADGELTVHLSSGDVQLHKPQIYQEAASQSSYGIQALAHRQPAIDNRQTVEGHFALDAQNHVRFALGPYDHQRPLIIDPVLAYATYVGGSGGDTGFAIAVDSLFDAYIAGLTNSSNYPTTGSPYQSSYNSNGDCFVTKINSAGTALIYSTYLGGSQNDTATALTLYNGDVILTGYTSSTDFPTKAPAGIGTTVPFQQIYGGNTDAFVAELDTLGQTLVYSTFLGGSGLDEAQGVAVDASGNAYVTGFTQSSNFPISAGAFQSSLAGSQNAFITKLNSSGEAVTYSTYLGGSSADTAQAIQVDTASPPNMYVTGYTFSSNFPTASAVQKTIGGAADAFVAELNGAGSALTFSTFLGGTGNDEAFGLALDSSKNIYVTGSTVSSNFPVTSGVLQSSLKGAEDAFVAKYSAGGAALAYATYLGGTGIDQGTAIAVTPAGIVFVTGLTESSDFPTANAIQSVLGLSNNAVCGATPCPDAFVTKLDTTQSGLSALLYSTYLGGNGYDSGQAIAVDSSGDPYITGLTISTNFPAVPGIIANATSYTQAYKTTLTGTTGNAFIAKIDTANTPTLSILPTTLNFGNETISVTSAAQQVTLVNPSTAPLTITSIQSPTVNNSVTVFTVTEPTQGGCIGTLSPNGGICNFGVTFTPNSLGAVTVGNSTTTGLLITDNVGGTAGTQQSMTLTGTGVSAATAVTVLPTSLSFTSQSVGTQSAPQAVTITNSGTQTLNITGFSLGSSNDFTVITSQTGSQVPSCTSKVNTLVVGDSCSVYVYFSPTASGNRSATLAISDNATGSPQNVTLTGIGAAAFTLNYLSTTCGNSTLTNPTIIGSTQTTFCVVANGPNSFTGAITLACSAGTTCAFGTNPIFVTNTTTMTVSNLTSSMPNPTAFTVTGTSGSQSTSVNVNLEFEDYTLAISPSSNIIQAGSHANYVVYVNPLFGFDQAVQLSCYTFTPALSDSSCSFTPSQVTPNGSSPTQVQLSISTARFTPQTTTAPPWFPGGKLPPIILGILSLVALASLAFGNRRRARQGWLGTSWLGVRVAALSLILALDLALVACRANTLTTSGTATGNYVVQIQGQLVSNTSVNRYATTNLSVTTTAP